MIDVVFLLANLSIAAGVFVALEDWRLAAPAPIVAQLLVVGVARLAVSIGVVA